MAVYDLNYELIARTYCKCTVKMYTLISYRLFVLVIIIYCVFKTIRCTHNRRALLYLPGAQFLWRPLLLFKHCFARVTSVTLLLHRYRDRSDIDFYRVPHTIAMQSNIHVGTSTSWNVNFNSNWRQYRLLKSKNFLQYLGFHQWFPTILFKHDTLYCSSQNVHSASTGHGDNTFSCFILSHQIR